LLDNPSITYDSVLNNTFLNRQADYDEQVLVPQTSQAEGRRPVEGERAELWLARCMIGLHGHHAACGRLAALLETFLGCMHAYILRQP
jgi:hypothetical protein